MNCLAECEAEKSLKVVEITGCGGAKEKLEKLGIREGSDIKVLEVSSVGFFCKDGNGKGRGRGCGNGKGRGRNPILIKIENSRVAVSPGLANKIFCEEV